MDGQKTLTYGDLDSLSSALALAVGANLMSLEEARVIWKGQLELTGLRQKRQAPSETKKTPAKTTKEVTK